MIKFLPKFLKIPIGEFVMITEEQLLNSFNNSQEFELVVNDVYRVLDRFPQYSEKMVNYLLDNLEQFKRLIKSSWGLSYITHMCPTYAERIIKAFLNEYEASQPILSGLYFHFKQYSHIAEPLLQSILINPQFVQSLFKYFILTTHDIRDIVVQYPNQAMLLIQTLCNDTEEFKRIINDSNALINLTKKALSEFDSFSIKRDYTIQADYVIQFVLSNPQEFKRLIRNKRDLTTISTSFPHYAHVLDKSSISEALICITKTKSSYEEIRKNATLLQQAKRTATGPSFFKDIPVELQEIIAAFTGDSEVHDEHESIKIARLS